MRDWAVVYKVKQGSKWTKEEKTNKPKAKTETGEATTKFTNLTLKKNWRSL